MTSDAGQLTHDLVLWKTPHMPLRARGKPPQNMVNLQTANTQNTNKKNPDTVS